MKFSCVRILSPMAILCALSGFVTATSKDQALRTMQIDLAASNNSIVHGKALFKENMDHSTNVVITLQNTKRDSIYLSQINNGSFEHPGSMALPLQIIRGTGSIVSQITFNVKIITNESGQPVAVTFDDLIKFPGYISIQLGGLPFNKPAAAGNILQPLSVILKVNKQLK